MLLVVVPSVLLADEWGAGSAGIIGGLTGLFSLVVFQGSRRRQVRDAVLHPSARLRSVQLRTLPAGS